MIDIFIANFNISMLIEMTSQVIGSQDSLTGFKYNSWTKDFAQQTYAA